MKVRIANHLVALVAFATLLGGVAHAGMLDDIKKAGVLQVGVSLSVKPYNYAGDQMQPAGSDVDAAQLLANDLGVKLEIVQATIPARIPSLLSKKVDIVMSGLAVTEEREKVIDFSLPYSADLIVLVGPKTMEIKGYADLKGKVVGTTRGTASDRILTDLNTGAIIRRYDDMPTTTTALTTGQVPLEAGSVTILQDINAATNDRFEVKFNMQSSLLAIGLRKDNPDMKAFLDDWVRKNHAMASSTTSTRSMSASICPTKSGSRSKDNSFGQVSLPASL